jgi:hypothetical protein
MLKIFNTLRKQIVNQIGSIVLKGIYQFAECPDIIRTGAAASTQDDQDQVHIFDDQVLHCR